MKCVVETVKANGKATRYLVEAKPSAVYLSYELVLAMNLEEYYSFPPISAILTRLRDELDPSLLYHSYNHTVEVIRDSITYGTLDGLSKTELRILALAAAFHDAGFLVSKDAHEERGAEIAVSYLNDYTFCTVKELELIITMIRDTKVVITGATYWRPPEHKLSCYLLDADVSNLGREDFMPRTEALARELGAERESFLRQSLKFLERHRWYTLPAKQLRQEIKDKNLNHLRQFLGREEGLSWELRTTLPKLTTLLKPPDNFPINANRVLEEVAKLINAQVARATLTIKGGGTVSFIYKDANFPGSTTFPSLYEDSTLAVWIIETSSFEEESSVEREIITVPIPPFSMYASGYIQVLNEISGEERFKNEDVLFLEGVADCFSLGLSTSLQTPQLPLLQLKNAAVLGRWDHFITDLFQEILKSVPKCALQEAKLEQISRDTDVDFSSLKAAREAIKSFIQSLFESTEFGAPLTFSIKEYFTKQEVRMATFKLNFTKELIQSPGLTSTGLTYHNFLSDPESRTLLSPGVEIEFLSISSGDLSRSRNSVGTKIVFEVCISFQVS